MITAARIAKWKALIAAATPGPWDAVILEPHVVEIGGPAVREGGVLRSPIVGETLRLNDAELITESRAALPELIAELEAHRARASGICSAHQHAEDPSCETCYPVRRG